MWCFVSSGSRLGRVEGIDALLAESRNAIPHEIAAHDPVGKPPLENLVDHALAAPEVWLALRKQRRERHCCLDAAALGVPDPQADVRGNGGSGSGAHLIC